MCIRDSHRATPPCSRTTPPRSRTTSPCNATVLTYNATAFTYNATVQRHCAHVQRHRAHVQCHRATPLCSCTTPPRSRTSRSRTTAYSHTTLLRLITHLGTQVQKAMFWLCHETQQLENEYSMGTRTTGRPKITRSKNIMERMKMNLERLLLTTDYTSEQGTIVGSAANNRRQFS